MSMKSGQSNEFNIVIESLDKEHERILQFSEILDTLKAICEEYYLIRHYADLNDNGELKREHYHAVIRLSKRIRKMTLINLLAQALNINVNMISCDILYNKRSAVRYLIHLDNPEKYQYEELNIFNNCDGDLFNILHYDISNLDTEQLIDIVKNCKGAKLEIMRVLGLKTYNQYWRMIEIIIREIYID